MLKSTTWVGTVWCGRDTGKTSPMISVPELKSSAGTRRRCPTSSPSNAWWDTTVGETTELLFLALYVRSGAQSTSQKTQIAQDIFVPVRVKAAWLNIRLLLFQTTRKIPTQRAIPAKPSAAVTTWDQGGHGQGAATILRSEDTSTLGQNQLWDLLLVSQCKDKSKIQSTPCVLVVFLMTH